MLSRVSRFAMFRSPALPVITSSVTSFATSSTPKGPLYTPFIPWGGYTLKEILERDLKNYQEKRQKIQDTINEIEIQLQKEKTRIENELGKYKKILSLTQMIEKKSNQSDIAAATNELQALVDGMTPAESLKIAELAIEGDQPRLLDIIVSKGSDNFYALLKKSICYGKEKCFDVLLKYAAYSDLNYAFENEDGRTHDPLLLEVAIDRIKLGFNAEAAERMLKSLIKAGADPKKSYGYNNSPTRSAKGDMHILNLLFATETPAIRSSL